MIFKWHNLFKQNRESLEDDPRPGRPIDVTTPENVQLQPYLKILRDHLGITLVYGRWVSRILTLSVVWLKLVFLVNYTSPILGELTDWCLYCGKHYGTFSMTGSTMNDGSRICRRHSFVVGNKKVDGLKKEAKLAKQIIYQRKQRP